MSLQDETDTNDWCSRCEKYTDTNDWCTRCEEYIDTKDWCSRCEEYTDWNGEECACGCGKVWGYA